MPGESTVHASLGTGKTPCAGGGLQLYSHPLIMDYDLVKEMTWDLKYVTRMTYGYSVFFFVGQKSLPNVIALDPSQTLHLL